MKKLFGVLVFSLLALNVANAKEVNLSCELSNFFTREYALEDDKQTNDLEESTEEITKSEYSEDKAEQMIASIKSQLTYLDNNNSLDGILQIENHIRELKKYGEKLELIAEALRKQSKNSINKDIYGSWVVDNATSVVLEGNTIKAIEDNFNRKFKVA